MGMVIVLRRASAKKIDELVASSTGWQSFAFEEGDPDRDVVDFDKAWHVLHFILTGAEYDTESPLGIIASNRQEYGTDENGFGGFAVITPEEMKAFYTALSAIDDAELASRYDADATIRHDLYIADAIAQDGHELALEYIMQSVPALRILASDCASNGDGALRILS